jgi:hypothetical protein
MAKEIMLFFRDGTYKIYGENHISQIAEEDLGNSMMALVAVKSYEAQQYLPVDPDYLITRMEPGEFQYSLEYDSISSDLDPSYNGIFPLPIHKVDLMNVFDFYDAIYFIMEMGFIFEMMNPDRFDDFRVLDVMEAHIEIPDSNQGPITFHSKIKKTKVTNPNNLVCGEICIHLCKRFGIMKEFNKVSHTWIRIQEDHKWESTETLNEMVKKDTGVSSFPIDTGSLVFANVNMLRQLEDVDIPMYTAYLYDRSMLLGEGSRISKLIDDMNADHYVDDIICDVVSGSLLSRSGVLSFLIELPMLDECFKLTMALNDFTNCAGVYYELTNQIQKKIPDPIGNPRGLLKSKAKTKWVYDFDDDKDRSILGSYLDEYEKTLRAGFRIDDTAPF